MGTKFGTIYNRFLGKITDDMYMELTPRDTIRDLRSMLLDSLPGFEYPRQNLFDYHIETKVILKEEATEDDFIVDDSDIGLPIDFFEDPMIERITVDYSYFNFDLTSEEINILATLMMNVWLQRQITSIENIRMKYSGTDFKMTSQANHLSKLQTLLTECQRQSHHFQRLYKRREIANGGKYQSTWYQFGPNDR